MVLKASGNGRNRRGISTWLEDLVAESAFPEAQAALHVTEGLPLALYHNRENSRHIED